MWLHVVKIYNYTHAVNVSIGLIGGGNITDTHARAVRAVAGADVAAIYGTNIENVRRSIAARRVRFRLHRKYGCESQPIVAVVSDARAHQAVLEDFIRAIEIN